MKSPLALRVETLANDALLYVMITAVALVWGGAFLAVMWRLLVDGQF